VYDWINASFGDPTVRKNGAIVSADFNLREVARRTFTNAQITSFTMPLLVNRPQAIPAMTVTFSAETVSDDTPSSAPVSGPKQKAWLTSNFRFDCPGLPANRVASIDSFHYMFEIVEQPDGSSAVRKNPSDLRCIVDPAGAPAFQQWYDNFALGGDSSDERDATLTVYGLTPQLPLFRANFKRLGINQVVPDTVLRRFNVELYVEQADWDLGKNKGG
jgi:hypothetical protein